MSNKVLKFLWALNIMSISFICFLVCSGCVEGNPPKDGVHSVHYKQNEGVTIFDSYVSKIDSKDLNIHVGDIFFKNVYQPYNMIDKDGNDASPYVDYENPDYFEKTKHSVSAIKGEQVKYDKPSEENGTLYSIVTITQVMPNRIKGYIRHENGEIEEVNDVLEKFTRSTNYYFINSKGMLEMAETGIDKEADSYRKKIGNYCIGNVAEARKWGENTQLVVTNCNDSSVVLEKAFIVRYSSCNTHKHLKPDEIKWQELNWCGIISNEENIKSFISDYKLILVNDNLYRINIYSYDEGLANPEYNDYYRIDEVYLPKHLLGFLEVNRMLNTIKH